MNSQEVRDSPWFPADPVFAKAADRIDELEDALHVLSDRDHFSAIDSIAVQQMTRYARRVLPDEKEGA